MQWQVMGQNPFEECKQSIGILCCKVVAIESNQLARNDHQRGVEGPRPRKYAVQGQNLRWVMLSPSYSCRRLPMH